jgi:hypothetical protein
MGTMGMMRTSEHPYKIIKLIGGLEHGFYLSIYWEVRNPNRRCLDDPTGSRPRSVPSCLFRRAQQRVFDSQQVDGLEGYIQYIVETIRIQELGI